MVWVPYNCSTAVCCLSLPLLLLLFCFARVYLCLLARVGVLGHRRGTALGHPCRMPPTGAKHCCAIIEDLACSGFNLHQQPSVVGLSVGMMAVRAVLYCCAVLCCCCRSCCLCMLPPRSPKTLLYCQKVPQNLTNK